jgi:hypothetical protein
MTIRLATRAVTFSRPFTLNEEDGERPAGAYVVETEEEKVSFLLFFSTFRRRSTVMHDSHAQGALMRFFTVDPAELEKALARDNEVALQIGMR